MDKKTGQLKQMNKLISGPSFLPTFKNNEDDNTLPLD